MRAHRLVAAGAFILGIVASSGSASAGALKVMSVDQRGMVVLDRPTVQRVGDKVKATLLTVSNRGYLPLAYYEQPTRSSISVDCSSETFSLNEGTAQPIAASGAVARTRDWLCKGIAPAYSVEAGYFGGLARAYLAYVAVTPGVFFAYNP